MLRLSPVAASGGYSLVWTHGLLLVVTTSSVAERGLQGGRVSVTWDRGLGAAASLLHIETFVE